jgi:sec-independent protein translocase protein TatA
MEEKMSHFFNLFAIFSMPGGWEMVIIVLGILLLFGGKKIPELAQGIGKGIKEFKKATQGGDDSDKNEKTDGK